MPVVNIVFEDGSGRILSANIGTITPIPVGHTLTTKTIDSIPAICEKRINPSTLNLVDKDRLQIDSDTTVNFNTVITTVFTKRDGETNELLDDVTDNDTIQISSRKDDLTFKEVERKAFFDVLQTALLQGAGQVRIATGAAPGKETIVLFNDGLTPVFETFIYV